MSVALAHRARDAFKAGLSEKKAVEMVEQSRKGRDTKAEGLKLIREVAARFTSSPVKSERPSNAKRFRIVALYALG